MEAGGAERRSPSITADGHRVPTAVPLRPGLGATANVPSGYRNAHSAVDSIEWDQAGTVSGLDAPTQMAGAERLQNSRFNAALIFVLLVDRSFHYLAASMPPSMGVRLRCRQAPRAIKPAMSRQAQNPLRGTHIFNRWQFSSVHRTSCHAYLIRARDPLGLYYPPLPLLCFLVPPRSAQAGDSHVSSSGLTTIQGSVASGLVHRIRLPGFPVSALDVP